MSWVPIGCEHDPESEEAESRTAGYIIRHWYRRPTRWMFDGVGDNMGQAMSEVVPECRNTRRNTKQGNRYEARLAYVLELVGQVVVKYVSSFMGPVG